ncbi:MAG: TolC family protein [Chlorobi bacterium]|nr:TolC family protein [Chlorobiota bacterium]
MKIIFLCLAAVWLVSVNEAPAQAPPDTVLHRYIDRALQVSPRLNAFRAQQLAVNRRIPQVSSLPDPRLAFSLNNLPINSFSFTQEGMTGKVIAISQTLPFPGKLSTRGDIVRQDEMIVLRQFEDERNNIIREVKKTYYELAYIKRVIRIEEQSRQLLRDISRIVRTKYEVGRGSQQDIVKSDLEITRITDRILKLQERYQSLAEHLNALLLREPHDVVVVDTLRDPSNAVFRINDLLDSARAFRPFLRGLEEAVTKARFQKELAELQWYPDFTVGVAYSQRDYLQATGTNLNDLTTFMVGINIPLDYGGKRSAAEEEATALERMYSDQYSSVLQTLQKLFARSDAAIATIRERIHLLETGLLPQASQALRASLAGYQVGEVDYLNVLDNQVKLFDIEMDLVRLRADYWKEIAEIEFLAGIEVQS